MLHPKQGKSQIRRVITYDLEWHTGKHVFSKAFKGMVKRPQVRLAGVFDGSRYRWYRTIGEFLNSELTHKNRGKWFYAHAGGLADMLFLLEYFVDDSRFEVEASFSGSSAIIVHVRRGHNAWHFIDSLWTFKGKLADLAKVVGMEKGDTDFDESTLAELIEYNELDCRILWTAIKDFETVLLNLGGQLQMTLASSAMLLFRKRFLKQSILTSQTVNECARESYFASRVEPFRLECKEGYYYDINSSFPHAMTFPCPANLRNSTARFSESDLQDDSAIFLVDATVSVPDMYFPPLPYRYKGSVFFPVGQWRGWFSNIDIGLLRETGGDIIKVHEVNWFHPFDDLSDFANTLYDMRVSCDTEIERLTYKLLMNSLYGKFAEGSLKTQLVLNPWELPPEEDMLFPGAYLVSQDVDIPHCHVPISTHITARSRAALYRYMAPCDVFHYCDTDGFCTTEPNLTVSPSLGGLKLEKQVKEGMFLRPKFYMTDSGDGKIEAKAKGFTLKPDFADLREILKDVPKDKRKEVKEAYEKEYSVAQWTKLINNEDIGMRRFTRVRELFRQGSRHGAEVVKPTERTIEKGLRGLSRPKRDVIPGPGGNTRPWTVSELVEDKPWKK